MYSRIWLLVACVGLGLSQTETNLDIYDFVFRCLVEYSDKLFEALNQDYTTKEQIYEECNLYTEFQGCLSQKSGDSYIQMFIAGLGRAMDFCQCLDELSEYQDSQGNNMWLDRAEECELYADQSECLQGHIDINPFVRNLVTDLDNKLDSEYCEPSITYLPVPVTEKFVTAPIVISEEPIPTSEEPIIRTEEPIPTSEEPIIRTEEPIPTSEEPIIKTEEPIPTSEEPLIRTEEPIPTSEEPIIITEEPIPTSEEPIIRTEEPNPTSEEPIIRTEEPIPTSMEPIIRTEEPNPTSEEPIPTSEEPIPTSEEPIIRTEEPNPTSEETIIRTEELIPTSKEPIIRTEIPLPDTEPPISTEDASSTSSIAFTRTEFPPTGTPPEGPADMSHSCDQIDHPINLACAGWLYDNYHLVRGGWAPCSAITGGGYSKPCGYWWAKCKKGGKNRHCCVSAHCYGVRGK